MWGQIKIHNWDSKNLNDWDSKNKVTKNEFLKNLGKAAQSDPNIYMSTCGWINLYLALFLGQS